MFDKLKKIFSDSSAKNTVEPPKKSESKKKAKTPKELATERDEPWVGIVSVELDQNDVGNGAFELDWNDKFIAKLVRAGYKGKTDQQLVDQWFQDICRNVISENFEQYEANFPRNEMRNMTKTNLGNGRSEIG